MVKLLLLMMLPACLPSTKIAGQRRMAEARVATCLRHTGCKRAEITACYTESALWCKALGLEKSCGEGGPAGVCNP